MSVHSNMLARPDADYLDKRYIMKGRTLRKSCGSL